MIDAALAVLLLALAAAPAEAGFRYVPAADGGAGEAGGQTSVGGTRGPAEARHADSSPGPGRTVPSEGVSGTRVSGTRVFAAEGCPRALLRRLLAGAAGEADALSALGIESEILTLCRERQEILVGLFEAEAALRELRTPRPDPAAQAAAKPAVALPSPAPARRAAPAAQSAAPSPLRAALASTAEKEKEPQAPARVSPARVSPRYAWFSIVGTAGALRAGVTDGSGVWFVREGDALPGGARIAAIAGRPPAVRIADAGRKGEATLLPYRARPGDAP